MENWKTERACRCGCGTWFMPTRRHHVYAEVDGLTHRYADRGKLMRVTPDEAAMVRESRDHGPPPPVPAAEYPEHRVIGKVVTSQAAYLLIGAERLTGFRWVIWKELWQAEPHGRTGDQLARFCGILVQTQTARCFELREAGLIVRTGEKRRTRAGRLAYVYRIAEQYREAS